MNQSTDSHPSFVLTGSILTGFLYLATCLVLALVVKEVPNPRQENGIWVTDMAEVLSHETEATLNVCFHRASSCLCLQFPFSPPLW